MSNKEIDFTNFYNLLTRGLSAVEERDTTEMLSVIKKIREGDFGDRKMVKDAIESFIARSHGKFSYRDVCFACHLTEKNDKNNASKILSRKLERGELNGVGGRNGWYEKPNAELNLMDWKTADTGGISLKFPLELEKMVKIFPKNIIVIAGERGAGKTSFCLDFTRLNMFDRDVYYFVNDMGKEEFRYRIQLFRNLKEDDWKFYPFERNEKFEEIIRPDEINIVDFLTATEDFALVGNAIEKIHAKLDQGVCLIALQKRWGQDVGVGGQFTLDKPRLYVSLSFGKAKVVKAKNWNVTENPVGKMINFKLVNGAEFLPQGEWASEEVYESFKPRVRF